MCATVKETAVDWTRLPDFPVTVIVLVARDAAPVVESVRVLLEVVEAGEKVADTPFGKPVAERLTLPVNPPVGEIVITVVALLPCFTVTADGEAVRLNPGIVTTCTTDAFAVV